MQEAQSNPWLNVTPRNFQQGICWYINTLRYSLRDTLFQRPLKFRSLDIQSAELKPNGTQVFVLLKGRTTDVVVLSFSQWQGLGVNVPMESGDGSAPKRFQFFRYLDLPPIIYFFSLALFNNLFVQTWELLSPKIPCTPDSVLVLRAFAQAVGIRTLPFVMMFSYYFFRSFTFRRTSERSAHNITLLLLTLLVGAITVSSLNSIYSIHAELPERLSKLIEACGSPKPVTLKTHAHHAEHAAESPGVENKTATPDQDDDLDAVEKEMDPTSEKSLDPASENPPADETN